MAVIEYDIHFGSGKPYVTTKVVEVDQTDKIRFTSNNPDAGIEYENDTPFNDPYAPQANQAFRVGAGTRDFDVAQRLTAKNRIQFACGEVEVVPIHELVPPIDGPTPPEVLKLKDRYAGEGTPNN